MLLSSSYRHLLVAASLAALVMGAGCNQSTEIPLAKVNTPPPLPAQDKAKSKAPTGHSPDVLPNGP